MANPISSVMNSSMKRRGSMFDGSMARLAPVGSSTRTFGEDPNSQTFLIKKLATRYQNTYKLEPDQRFECGKVQDSLEDMDYNIGECRQRCKSIADKIIKAVQNLGYKRHKIVALVHIGQLQDQGIRVGSRCLWDDKRDNWVCAFYEGKTLWATATVYGVYYE